MPATTTDQEEGDTMSLLDALTAAIAEHRASVETKRAQHAATIDPVKAAAAKVLGMKVSEITDVRHVAEGTAITTFDGAELLVVPADRPDDDGKTGLMLRRGPGRGSMHAYVPKGTRAAEKRTERRRRLADARELAAEAAKEAAKPVLSSPRMEMLKAMDAEAAAVVEAHGGIVSHPEVHVALEHRASLAKLISAERGRIIGELPPPPPPPFQITLAVEVVAWARAMAAATTPREESQVIADPRFARFYGWPRSPKMIDHELQTQLKFLAKAGLDEQGQPLPVAAPKKRRRSKRA